MPTYQYRCTECGNDLEAVQKFSDPALTECPTCHGSLRKVFNAVGVVFKGSGFYRTDSRPKEGASVDSSSAESKGKDSKGKDSKGKDGAAGGASDKKSSDSGSGNGSKSGDGAKTPAKASASTGSSSTS
jgi:putative FmdB family regulatory protein